MVAAIHQDKSDHPGYRSPKGRMACPQPQHHQRCGQSERGGKVDNRMQAPVQVAPEHGIIYPGEERMERGQNLDKAGDEQPVAAGQKPLFVDRTILCRAESMKDIGRNHDDSGLG